MSEKRFKHDEGKRDWTLIPWEPMEEIARVMEFGAQKYESHSWQKVKPFSRYLSAAFRHLLAYMKGEQIDPESGLHHLAHCAVNCLFLIWGDDQ